MTNDLFSTVFYADPIYVMRECGHTPILVTQRCVEYEAEIRAVVLDDLPIVYASGLAKEEAARRAGLDVQFWIDDSPYSVGTALRYRGCPEPAAVPSQPEPQ